MARNAAYDNSIEVLETKVAGEMFSTLANRNNVSSVGCRLSRFSKDTKVRSMPASNAKASWLSPALAR